MRDASRKHLSYYREILFFYLHHDQSCLYLFLPAPVSTELLLFSNRHSPWGSNVGAVAEMHFESKLSSLPCSLCNAWLITRCTEGADSVPEHHGELRTLCWALLLGNKSWRLRFFQSHPRKCTGESKSLSKYLPERFICNDKCKLEQGVDKVNGNREADGQIRH